MIKIALCINRTKERNSILQEITESFEQHNIPHDILVCSDSDDLMDKTRDTFCLICMVKMDVYARLPFP